METKQEIDEDFLYEQWKEDKSIKEMEEMEAKADLRRKYGE